MHSSQVIGKLWSSCGFQARPQADVSSSCNPRCQLPWSTPGCGYELVAGVDLLASLLQTSVVCPSEGVSRSLYLPCLPQGSRPAGHLSRGPFLSSLRNSQRAPENWCQGRLPAPARRTLRFGIHNSGSAPAGSGSGLPLRA